MIYLKITKIYFSDNSLETWTENIKNLYGNTDLLNKISEAFRYSE